MNNNNCVGCEIASTEAGSEDKGSMAIVVLIKVELAHVDSANFHVFMCKGIACLTPILFPSLVQSFY